MDEKAVAVVEWIKADRAAEILGISKRRVLEYAQAGAIKSQVIRDPETNQMTKQVHAGDVERLREERENPTPRAPQPSQAIAKLGSVTVRRDAARTLPQALEDAGMPPSELRHKLYLVEAEAIIYTGLGQHELRKHAKAERRGPRGALVYRRTELESI